jgi:hypothetical protein
MLRIISPLNSFVQFDNTELIESCEYADIDLCLPVYEDDDVWFQFVIEADTEEEADDLCSLTNAGFSIGIVKGCNDGLLLPFVDVPDRYRISPLQVLYNWSNGLPGFSTVIGVGKCFMVKVIINSQHFCSNCFQRIFNTCHTSVIEYGNEDNAFGFNYCNSAAVGSEGDSVDCDPTFISFINQSTLTIPYTASMIAKYGNVPTIKAWIYDTDGTLVNMSVRQALDTYPPTQILIDFGGPATGILKIS